MGEFQKKLAGLKKGWKQAQENIAKGGGGDFTKLEPGRYKGRVTDGEVNESQAGRFQCFMELTVTEGESKGESQRKYWGLDKAEHLPYLMRDIQRLGFDAPDDPEELEDVLKKIVKKKPLISFRVKEAGEFLNIYFDKLLDEEEEGGDDSGASEKSSAKGEQDAASKDPEPESAGGEDVEIKAGLRVQVEGQGEGEVKSVDEDEGEVTVKLDSGTKVIVSVDKLSLPPTKPEQKKMRVTRK